MSIRLVLAALALLLWPAGAGASCIPQNAAQQRARAAVIVEGRILQATERGDARLGVIRYLKGDGPTEVGITGAVEGAVATSIDILPRAGERWRIFGVWLDQRTIRTSTCAGSRRLEQVVGQEPRSEPGPVTAPAPNADAGSNGWWSGLAGAVGMLAIGAVLWRVHHRRRYASRHDR